MKLIYSIITVTALAFSAYAADPKYPVSDIPEDLKKDVNAVVREDITIYKILAPNKATCYTYFAVTIFNKNASDFASTARSYNRLTKITDFTGSVYDANGKLIKKLKGSEIYDGASFDGFSLYSDARFKSADLEQTIFPYTVVFEIEKEYKYLYGIDGSAIIPDEKVSVQKASYELIYPQSLEPRFKTHNIDVKPKKYSPEPGFESLVWNFENLKPITIEPLGRLQDVIPEIEAAPGVFEYDGYAGKMTTWDDYGKWQLSLNKGRDVLSEATKQKVRDLTKNLTTVEQKTKVLYEYLQSRTRYVSIQLGIGGLQPFEASVVDENGYGDCKALSNYMLALLKEAGIKGLYIIIYGDSKGHVLDEDFPSHQFNHVIAAVPNGKDTLWLECTDQTGPFGYQGKFTGDRKAFVVSESGSKIVNTTRYTAEQNLKSRMADVFVEVNGNAKAKVKTNYHGTQYSNGGLSAIVNSQYDEQKKWLQEAIDIPSFNLNAFTMQNKKDKIPTAIVNVDLTLNRLATVSGKRLFLQANLMNRSTYIPEKVENRKTKFYRNNTFTDFDTIRYHLPEQLYPEFLPEPTKITSRFGEYETKFSIDQGSLVYIRRIKMNKGEYPPEAYQELIDFYKGINKADNVKVVFLNKT